MSDITSNQTPPQDPSDAAMNAAASPPDNTPTHRGRTVAGLAAAMAIVTVAHLGALGWLFFQHLRSLSSGEIIQVYVMDVDQQDFVYGNELDLTYTFGLFSLAEIGGSDSFLPGDTAYVVLSPIQDLVHGTIWTPRRVENTQPQTLGDFDVVLKGTVTRLEQTRASLREGRPPTITIRYGIEYYEVTPAAEDYFNQDGAVPGGLIAVEISVSKANRPYRRGLLRLDGDLVDPPGLI